MTSSREGIDAVYRQAMACHEAGDLAEAQSGYLRALQLEPNNVEALTSLGVIYLQSNNAKDAVDIFGKAIALDSESSALPFYHRGVSFQQLGRHREAITSFDQAIALESDLDGVSYYGRGTSQIALSEQAAALESLQKAIENYNAAIAAHSPTASTFHNRGNAYAQLKLWEAALNDYDNAIALEPQYTEAYVNRGNVLSELQRWADALSSVEAAIRLNPDQAELHYNRGNILKMMLRAKDAFDSYDRAVVLDGNKAQLFCGRGAARQQLREFEAALEDYDRAIELSPGLAEAHAHRGNLLSHIGRFDEGLASMDSALDFSPNLADYHFNKAFTLLLTGQLEQGWLEFEWRLRQKNRHIYSPRNRDYTQPRWTGLEQLAGKTLFLYGEQGLGDIIQFCRYVALVANLGARVILEAPAALYSLFTTLTGVVDLVHEGDTPRTFDFHSSLLSLPAAFKTTVETIPREVPYLRINGAKSEFWKAKLGAKIKCRVGLVWSGGSRAQLPESLVVPAQRNIPLAKFQSFKSAEVEWFTLQKGQPAESELTESVRQQWNGPSFIDHTHLIEDFSDTAALIGQLDLVISVDTSTAHLTGALGKPVWILNRYDTCWRWMLQRADSPWYPTARLYRQEAQDDWDAVIQRVLGDLKRLL